MSLFVEPTGQSWQATISNSFVTYGLTFRHTPASEVVNTYSH